MAEKCYTLLLDEDGENRAVRAFLMQYGTPGLTVGTMKTNLRLSGWDGCWPEWANEQDKHHLTKGGAQHWLRHLFALEGKAGVASVDPACPQHGGSGAGCADLSLMECTCGVPACRVKLARGPAGEIIEAPVGVTDRTGPTPKARSAPSHPLQTLAREGCEVTRTEVLRIEFPDHLRSDVIESLAGWKITGSGPVDGVSLAWQFIAAERIVPAAAQPSDSQMLDWIEKRFDRADGEYRDRRSVTGWLSRYLYWGKRQGGSGNIRKAIADAMADK